MFDFEEFKALRKTVSRKGVLLLSGIELSIGDGKKGIHTIIHSYIKQIHFEGGTLDGQTIHFSPELNTLIGIRGSGKSSVMEAIRYVLSMPIDENDIDRAYKEKLVKYTLGSGGKVILEAVGRRFIKHGNTRIVRDLKPGRRQPASISHTRTRVVFFG